jgi:tetratricopeptide (TPR) repeat protein
MDTAKTAQNPDKKRQYYSLAIHELEKALKSTYWESYNDLGACFVNEGYLDSAITAYKKALEIDPEYVLASNNLGFIYLNKKQYNTAIPYFINSYKYAPNITPLINIVVCCQSEGNFILALHYDSLLLKTAPDYKPATLHSMSISYNNIGLDYLRNNELDKALGEFTIALSLDSNLIAAIKNMGLVYEKKGNTEMAKKYAQKALLLLPLQ